jgi:hypothetical protein
MLDHLRQKAAQTLASVSFVILSSYGPAEIQSSRVPCASQDLVLYIFIPHSSNHLLNLEQRSGIVAATDTWDLQGNARVLAPDEIPVGINPPETGADTNRPAYRSNPAWGWAVVEVRPSRLTLHSPTGLGNIETIDF